MTELMKSRVCLHNDHAHESEENKPLILLSHNLGVLPQIDDGSEKTVFDNIFTSICF